MKRIREMIGQNGNRPEQVDSPYEKTLAFSIEGHEGIIGPFYDDEQNRPAKSEPLRNKQKLPLKASTSRHGESSRALRKIDARTVRKLQIEVADKGAKPQYRTDWQESPARELSHTETKESQIGIINKGTKLQNEPVREELPWRAQLRAEVTKSQIGVIFGEAKPLNKPTREELPDLIDKFKVNEKEIEELEKSLENLYKRGNSGKEEVQLIVASLERDGIQMQEAITKLHKFRERTILENVDLQRLTNVMKREKNKVEDENLKLQRENDRLSVQNAIHKEEVYATLYEKQVMEKDMSKHIENLISDMLKIEGATKDIKHENEEIKKAFAKLQLENGHLASLKQELQLTVSDTKSTIQLYEDKLATVTKKMEEMEENLVRQRLEHGDLEASIKEREILIAQKDRDYQHLLEKNKAQKVIRMT